MSKIKVKTEKVGGGFWTQPAYRSTAYRGNSKITEAYSIPFGSASEAREKLMDKLATRTTKTR